ncbi:MAG: hypothetical protein GY940_28120, partial [bacterium]|nr:hypothetical protein [bacterium]
MPGNSVRTIRQTRDGYLWIGTQDGLVRFDGVDFDPFTWEKSPQSKGNVIRALYEDQHGNLWIGSTAGGLTRYKDGTFKTWHTSPHKTLSKIYALNMDQWENLWIGSFASGLTVLNLNTRQL